MWATQSRSATLPYLTSIIECEKRKQIESHMHDFSFISSAKKEKKNTTEACTLRITPPARKDPSAGTTRGQGKVLCLPLYLWILM